VCVTKNSRRNVVCVSDGEAGGVSFRQQQATPTSFLRSTTSEGRNASLLGIELARSDIGRPMVVSRTFDDFTDTRHRQQSINE
jgi:hypothetical protein